MKRTPDMHMYLNKNKHTHNARAYIKLDARIRDLERYFLQSSHFEQHNKQINQMTWKIIFIFSGRREGCVRECACVYVFPVGAINIAMLEQS